MAQRGRFSQEVQERAVRMVLDHQGNYASEWQAIRSIAEKIGCSAEAIVSGYRTRCWVRRWGRESRAVRLKRWGQLWGQLHNEERHIIFIIQWLRGLFDSRRRHQFIN